MKLGIRGKLIVTFALGTMVPVMAAAGLTYGSVRHLLERRESARAREIAALIGRGLERATKQLERDMRAIGAEPDVQDFLRFLVTGSDEVRAEAHRRMTARLRAVAGIRRGLIELRLMDHDGRDWFRSTIAEGRNAPFYPLDDESTRAYRLIVQNLSPPNFYVAGDELGERLRRWDPPGERPLRCALPLMATDTAGQPIPVRHAVDEPLAPAIAAAWIPAANARGTKARMGQVSRCATLVALIHPGSLVEDLRAGLAEFRGTLAMVDREGRLVAAFGAEPSADEAGHLAEVRRAVRDAQGEGWIETSDRSYLPATWSLPGSWTALGWEFLFSVPRSSLHEGEIELRRIHVFALLLGLLTGTVAAWLASGRLVGPVLAILEEKIEERTRQWRLAQDELEQHRRLSALGLLAGGVAHEVNNPVGTILTTARHVLSSPRFADQSPELRKEIEKIDRQAGRISRIVGELLIFARQSPRKPTPHRADQVIREAIRSVRELGKHAPLRVDCHVESELRPVPMDEHKMHQVLVNLISNGLDACEGAPPAGDEPAVTVSCRMNEGGGNEAPCLEIDVADRGRGMPADELGRVFDPFFTTKAPGRGTGLGLSLVYGVIQDHHGRISVESTVGSGTRFRIRLPAREGGAA